MPREGAITATSSAIAANAPVPTPASAAAALHTPVRRKRTTSDPAAITSAASR
jgi:hypothetical protein